VLFSSHIPYLSKNLLIINDKLLIVKSDDIERRFREAEKTLLKSRPPEKHHKWLRTKCPKCDYRIDYDPKPDWSGTLKCPTCGKVFKVVRLNDF